ncbi:unnamed protein product [Lactuca saligna]|uniref:Uncharacterized protein n=1 Tax=Lactuca saligna TaxID=75948 RepID=A0AA36E8X9_LACSI|nr:unnamed protein product [Lactuca saligna]
MDLGCLDLGCIEKQTSQSSVDSDINPNDSLPSSSKPPKSKKMDFGCLDLGCIEKEISQSSVDSEINSNRSCPSTSKPIKSKMKKDPNQPSPRPLNKLASQIKKPTRRKTSPLSWFPRKKVDSYLTRKLKLLQEVDGMNSTLDETLGDTNPHFSKVLREKIAVKEAAHRAIEARKAALVEASWCRILHAARIESKEAESLLAKAEETATQAFESAKEIGVIMYDIPDCSTKHYKIEKSSENGQHTVTTSFDTAFEVDKQVAAALKAAFVRLSSCASIGEAEFKELLKKISQNPDLDEKNQDLCEEPTPDCESESQKNEMELSKEKEKESLVDMMLERLKSLKEEELASLATIVATCGLNAALAEAQNGGGGGKASRKQHEEEHPGLDKFLVKRLTKLEKEIQDAKNAKNDKTKVEKVDDIQEEKTSTEGGLEGILVKHYSKLEKEIQEAKKNNFDKNKKDLKKVEVEVVPELGSMLMKHTSKLVKEIEEAKRKCGSEYEYEKKVKRSERLKQEMKETPSLGEVLVKRVSRLEREVLEAKKEKENVNGNKERVKEKEDNGVESLEKILVKPKLKVERVKVVGGFEESGEQMKNPLVAKREARERELEAAWGGMSFGNSIRPGLSRLQREKAAWIKKAEEEEKGAFEEPRVV